MGGESKEGKKRDTKKKIPSDIAHTAASIKVEQMDNLSKASSQLPLSLSLSPANPLLPRFAFQCLIYALPGKHEGKTFPPHQLGINVEQITAAP